MTAVPASSRVAAWIARWRPILPLFLAEFVVWLGFGAFLPILPLYLKAQGIDFATLGLIVAAWPAARLVAEPVFGWIADRTARKPLMVAALLANAVVIPLPLFVSGAVAFVFIRALAGLATAAYDPAARGFLVDATPADRQGEAFGLYGAAQMGGLLFGPAIGGLGASLVGAQSIVFWLAAVSSAASAMVILVAVREGARTRVGPRIPAEGVTELPGSSGQAPGEPWASEAADARPRQRSIVNRLLIAAILINAGGAFAQGTYEVVWSLFLTSLGAGLDLVGATFATFAIPILLFSPVAGRYVDRRGGLPFIIAGTFMTIFSGVAYTIIDEPTLAFPLILIEASGFAILFPALYAIVAAGSPPGRSSTAQGLFGAAGTVGFIVSALIAGRLADIDIRLPFWMFVATTAISLALGLAIGAGPIRALRPGRGGGTFVDDSAFSR
ncbi:MAG: transporter, family, multidrug resistance protein [Chloroflexota bacterium]|jgi:MFS family permease|nr:transporter, family, multidrug resistance protein [Chloroflexota bacterium]